MLKRWRVLPARIRLTLWYVLLLAGTLLALGAFALWLVGRTLASYNDDLLRSKAAAVSAEVDVTKKKITFAAEGGSKTAAPTVVVGLDVVRIWNRDGNRIYQYNGGVDLGPGDFSGLEPVLAGEPAFSTVFSNDGRTIRLYAEPIQDHGKLVGVLQVGRSDAEAQTLLDTLRQAGLGGMLLALPLAWWGGLFLSHRALAPVDRTTRAAERIEAVDLSLRLPTPAVNDEFGRLANAFNGMIDRLEQAFSRQRRFTADASHELRTPLAVMRAQIEVALKDQREATYDTRVYTSLQEEVYRLGNLVESLLFLARADEGQSLTLVRVDLEEIVFDAAALVMESARQHGIQLQVDPCETPPVRGEATLLGQLVVNLLNNAIRHTPRGGRVTVRLTSSAGAVSILVSDTGEGIAPEHLPRLFERFYRADPSRTRGSGGSGLGLAICDWVAQMHGGRLSVHSTVGTGSTFRLDLPVDAAEGQSRSEPGTWMVGEETLAT